MINYSEIYPEDCNPENMWKRITERLRTFYTDVQNKGFYPEWKLIEYKNAGIELKMEDGDLETLKVGYSRLYWIFLLFNKCCYCKRRC